MLYAVLQSTLGHSCLPLLLPLFFLGTLWLFSETETLMACLHSLPLRGLSPSSSLFRKMRTDGRTKGDKNFYAKQPLSSFSSLAQKSQATSHKRGEGGWNDIEMGQRNILVH